MATLIAEVVPKGQKKLSLGSSFSLADQRSWVIGSDAAQTDLLLGNF
jgi:hypothetical protein